MYFNLAVVLLGFTFTSVFAAPVDTTTPVAIGEQPTAIDKQPTAIGKQPEKRALTDAQALAGCKVPEANKSIFWTNSKHSGNAQDVADQYGDEHDLITMDEACESILEGATTSDLPTISKAFAQATINAGSTIAYVVLPDSGAGSGSMWIKDELPVLTKAKITLHKISLEDPSKPVVVTQLG